jgi:hypothetical protein
MNPPRLYSVVETQAFSRQAAQEGMTEIELMAAVDIVSSNPKAGDLIVGSGGCRKVRVPKEGKGKSGGYRVVTFFLGEQETVFLMAALAKGSRENFSQAEVNAMAKVTSAISKTFAPRETG